MSVSMSVHAQHRGSKVSFDQEKRANYLTYTEARSLVEELGYSILSLKEYWLSLNDAKKIRYRGVGGKEYVFYHRKSGCSYYDQYLSYRDADVVIFNSMKYKIELAIGRKPETDVEIIDEGDEFLDKLAEQEEINLNRLEVSLKMILSS